MTTPALRPHHDGSPLYVSHPAPVLGDEVDVRIRIPDGYGPVIRVLVRSNPDHEPAWVDAVRDGMAEGMESNMSWSCPPMRSVSAGALPL